MCIQDKHFFSFVNGRHYSHSGTRVAPVDIRRNPPCVFSVSGTGRTCQSRQSGADSFVELLVASRSPELISWFWQRLRGTPCIAFPRRSVSLR